MNTIQLLNMIFIIIVVLIMLLGGLVILILFKKRKEQEQSTEAKTGETTSNKEESKMQGKEFIHKFMEFDDVVDNMIVRKNRTQYVMVVQCKGVNYDLLSEAEKDAVENGFTQFLNTLRFPVQLYVQTRSLNLRDIIEEYKSRVNAVRNEIEELNIKIKRARAADNYKMLEKLEFEKRRKQNVLEYGTDIANYTERMSQNQNVLQQHTYLIVSYYTAEFGGEINNYDKSEVDNIVFSELYTRVQTLIRSLASAEVYGRVLDSEELAELLYVAYNRDESEILNLRQSLDAGFDSLYSTAEDMFEKKKAKIEMEVEERASEIAAASLLEADRIRLLEKRKAAKIKERANEIVEEYRDEMEDDLYKETVRQIDIAVKKEKAKEEAVKANKSEKSKKIAKHKSGNTVKKKRLEE